ncbi:MAG TPA: M28 family peptidase [Cyclobacteriaceae bacterium]|nr:M28 family peptidase [Cyclobacteriaceae bacterium]
MNRTIISISLLLFSRSLFAQGPEPYASMIDIKDLKENLTILSSDALEGRLTGTRGQKMAAAFIADHFQQLDLTPVNKGSFYQRFNLYSYKQDEISIKTKSAAFTTSADVVFYGSADSDGEKEYEVVFAGQGTEAELAQVSVRDRVVLIVAPELSFSKLGPLISKITASGAVAVLMYSTVPDAEYKTFMEEIQGTLTNGRMSLKRAQPNEPQLFFVSKKVVDGLFGNFEKLRPLVTEQKKNALKKVKPVKAVFKQKITEDVVETENVMGFLEGTDKKEEVLLITAHYDHIGLSDTDGDRVNNGADDDGSGTVTVLQMATAFAKAKKDGHGPRRSILFMTVTAEELGLYGSQYYTDTQPVIPLDRTVVDLNIDMIGRWDAEHAGKAPYVYVIGADKLSSELQEINVRNNEKYTKLEFDYTYNDENHPTNLYQRSDHWNFAKHGVPIIFFFDGIHEDYHKVSDEVGKIDFDILRTRGRAVFYTAWEIANRDQRLRVDK